MAWKPWQLPSYRKDEWRWQNQDVEIQIGKNEERHDSERRTQKKRRYREVEREVEGGETRVAVPCV